MSITGFDKINLDVHMECMSIVTDATQNQNGPILTKSEIIGILAESSFGTPNQIMKCMADVTMHCHNYSFGAERTNDSESLHFKL